MNGPLRGTPLIRIDKPVQVEKFAGHKSPVIEINEYRLKRLNLLFNIKQTNMHVMRKQYPI